MNNRHRSRLLVLTTVAALGLAGCGGVTIDGVTFSADDDGFSVSSDEGEFALGRGLPADFPNEVPLYDGEVVSGASVAEDGETGWAIQLLADETAPQVLEAIHSQLTASGYSTETETDFGELTDETVLSAIVFSGPEYNVSVAVISHADQEGTLVNYSVVRSRD